MYELVVLNPPRRKKRKTKGYAGLRKKGRFVSRRAGTSAAKRRAAGLKAARTRAAKAAARSRAGKKAAKTRKRRAAAKARKPRRKTTKKRARKRAPRKKKPMARRKKARPRRRKKSRPYRPTLHRRRKVSMVKKKRIKRAVGRYAKWGRAGSLRINPRHRKRRYKRRRRNIGQPRKIVRGIQQAFTVKSLTEVSQTLIGATLALMIPPYVAKATRQPMLNRGWIGVVANVAASVIASTVASQIGFRKAAPKILAGGILASGSQALRMILPPQFKRWIPRITLDGFMPSPTRMLPGPPGMLGLGAYMTEDQLIEGETPHAYMGNTGDWLTLSGGMGQGYEVPRAAIAGMGRGYAPMGDWFTLKQYPQAPTAVGLPAYSPPAEEQF